MRSKQPHLLMLQAHTTVAALFCFLHKTACNIEPLAPLQTASEFNQKRQWDKLNKTLTCPAWQVMFWAKSNFT